MKKKLVIFLVSFLLLFPIAIIVYVTWKDVQKYDVDDYFTVQEKSFGEAREVMVSDIEESVQLKGTITSIDYDFYYIYDSNADIYVTEQQEIFKGSKLASDNGNIVYADSDGIVEGIMQTEYGYKLKVLNFKQLLAKLELDGNTDLKVGKEYVDVNGDSFRCEYKSNQVEKGKRVYYFKPLKKYMYGQTIQIDLKTSRKESNVLVVEKDAIFTDSSNQSYIRLVDKNDNVIGDKKVSTGISDGLMISITGVDEGDLYDVEYAKYINQSKSKVAEDERNTENSKSE